MSYLFIISSYIDQFQNVNNSCSAKGLNSIIDYFGCTYYNIILNLDQSFNYTALLKSRLRNPFIQEWSNCINNTSKLDY